MRRQGSKAPSTSRKKGKQLNALVSPGLFDRLAEYCRVGNLKRDRTVEFALSRFLRAGRSDQDREFHVLLSDDAARRLSAFRHARRMPDRNLLIEEAVLSHIIAVLETDGESRERFEQIIGPVSPDTN